VDDLGFRLTDVLDAKGTVDAPDGRILFTSHGSDHHSLLLGSMAFFTGALGAQRSTLNQLSWQVGSLAEIVNGAAYLEKQGYTMSRVGRDMPGSNWHAYFSDPDGHLCELYYGMEQIGWNRMSKPSPMYDRAFYELPSLPQMSEEAEIVTAEQKGVDLLAGFRPELSSSARFEVEGVLLHRPFRVTGHGPISLFVRDPVVSERFYTETLGFVRSETTTVLGHRCAFLRTGTEHHSLALLPEELRKELGVEFKSTVASIGVRLASYRQLRAAIQFLREKGWRFVDLPGDLFPGIDYVAHMLDPDGHVVSLHYYMERIGWDGRPRPSHVRPPLSDPWPEVVEAQPDAYADQVFPGPLG
jgi:catechol 2,3-dioxygenase-like lactoylglutathione lyase family enzyme